MDCSPQSGGYGGTMACPQIVSEPRIFDVGVLAISRDLPRPLQHLVHLIEGQRRKGIAQEPYINHLLEVASLVSEATSGSDATVVIAALLHDAVEDQEVPVEMIAREFGKQVSDIVMEVTDDKTLPKDDRKRKQIETAPKKSREAKLIKLADKTSNLRAVASSPAADWSVKRRLEYIEWAKNVVAGLRGISPWLEQQFDEAVAAAERSLNPLMAGA
jgi:(p)ppGpp synthase/HD superfamily hydrolase